MRDIKLPVRYKVDLPRFNGAFEARETLANYNDTITSKAGLSTGLGGGQVSAPS